MTAAFDIFNQYAADPNKELDGVWVRLGGPNETPARIKVARSGNKRHSRIITQLYEANKPTLDLKNDVADAKGEEITVEAMAKGVLLGWENVSFKGEAIKDGWDIDTAKMLLGVKDFRELVNKHAMDFNKFKAVQDEADAGN